MTVFTQNQIKFLNIELQFSLTSTSSDLHKLLIILKIEQLLILRPTTFLMAFCLCLRVIKENLNSVH